MQSFLSLEILFLTLITPTLLCITFSCNFTDTINVSLRFGHDYSTMICSAPIGGAFNNVSARRATERTPPERERSPAR